MNFIKNCWQQFTGQQERSSEVAKGRLQFVISQERALRKTPEAMAQLQQDLIDVISKYVALDKDAVNVEVKQVNDMWELNIVLPDQLHEVAAASANSANSDQVIDSDEANNKSASAIKSESTKAKKTKPETSKSKKAKSDKAEASVA